jgi:glyoxylase I family protein
MPGTIATGAVQHCTLTVRDVQRSAAFYVEVLGFRRTMEVGSRVLLGNGSVILTLTPQTPDAPETANAETGRVGVDYLSFTVASRDELEAARQVMQDHNIAHDEIQDLGPDLGLYVLSFRDPDNIPLELRAPYPLI